MFLMAFGSEEPHDLDKVRMQTEREQSIIRAISEGDQAAFEQLFFEYHQPLIRFAFGITRSKELSRDTVQDVFLKIWRNRKAWIVNKTLRVYLYQSVRNQALNLLEKQKTHSRLQENYSIDYSTSYSLWEEDRSSFVGLSEHDAKRVMQIWALVDKMPDRRRLVFELHRKDGLSYKEISKILDLSLKTVENHMGQAIKYLRKELEKVEKKFNLD